MNTIQLAGHGEQEGNSLSDLRRMSPAGDICGQLWSPQVHLVTCGQAWSPQVHLVTGGQV